MQRMGYVLYRALVIFRLFHTISYCVAFYSVPMYHLTHLLAEFTSTEAMQLSNLYWTDYDFSGYAPVT